MPAGGGQPSPQGQSAPVPPSQLSLERTTAARRRSGRPCEVAIAKQRTVLGVGQYSTPAKETRARDAPGPYYQMTLFAFMHDTFPGLSKDHLWAWLMDCENNTDVV
jgi:hypothetical protein